MTLIKKYIRGWRLVFRPIEPLDIANFTEDQSALRFITTIHFTIAAILSVISIIISLH